MKNDVLRYPAVFFSDDDSISVYFPDIDQVTCGNNLEHAYEMAKEILGIWFEENIKTSVAPQPTVLEEAIKKLRTGEYNDEITQHGYDSLILPVEVDLKLIRRLQKKAVKINTSIPAWMKAEADRQGVNISKVLQNALMHEFERL